jgi:dihydrofolate reductase
MNSFKAIAAMSENRVIGNQGGIPWHLPEDFKWFKQTTMGDILVMGRKTYASIGRPLPGRQTYVLSRQQQAIEGVEIIHSLDTLNKLKTDRTIWIAGGGDIYKQLLPMCEELYLSRVHREVEGDAFFPEFESSFELNDILLDAPGFTVERWVRNPVSTKV